MAGTAAVLEALRAKIRTLQAQPRQVLLGLRTGVAELDALGAFRLGVGVELSGALAAGRTSLALALVAAAGREQRRSAWVDGPAELYPPAAAALGVDLARLLIARPKAREQLVWTAVQLLRSGAFTCVVLDLTHTGVSLSLPDTKKLQDAARVGGALLLVLTLTPSPAPGLLRLQLETRASPLRLVHDADAGDDEALHLESPHGRRASLPRARLQPRGPVRARRLRHPWAAPPLHRVAAEASLQRPRKNLLRDGYGLVGGRPGRDGPLRLPRPGPGRR